MKKTWEGINNILNRKSKKSITIKAMKDPNNKNNISKDPSLIADILNHHFASVGTKLANNLPPSQQEYRHFLSMNKSPHISFLFDPVTATEIELEILSLPDNKAHGLYSCPTKLLKCTSKILSNTLAKIFNLSVSTGSYPSKLKKSKIIPIFKTDDDTDANNYRTISLLSNFNRICEKIMYKRMKDYIEFHGFRQSHSTEHALLDMVSKIQLTWMRVYILAEFL